MHRRVATWVGYLLVKKQLGQLVTLVSYALATHDVDQNAAPLDERWHPKDSGKLQAELQSTSKHRLSKMVF